MRSPQLRAWLKPIACSDDGGSQAPVDARRRLVLQGSAAAFICLADARTAWANVGAGLTEGNLTPGSAAFVEAYCDTLIPAGSTPGAVEAGVPLFVEVMVDAMVQQGRNDFLKGLAEIGRILRERCGVAFFSAPMRERAAELARFDSEVLAEQPGESEAFACAEAYRRLRAMTIFGYYTSEVGASIELQYTLVPGRYDADIPVDPDERAHSIR